MDGCIFCKIVKGEIPAKKIYEDNNTLAFLDINPANPGHMLVTPKKHYETIYDIDEKILENIMIVIKKMAKSMKDNLRAEGVNIIQNNGKAAGQLVNHIHFHIIPRYEKDNVVISYPRAKVDENTFNDIQKKLTGTKKRDLAEEWETGF